MEAIELLLNDLIWTDKKKAFVQNNTLEDDGNNGLEILW